ncbi:hypothetical protein [Acinetobacter sp. HY1485]|uniref:hypothetical protein n=1 Tax=Acinetobacter sp. HY1485 TaxID=2970918 RepID=UPI0022B95E53|nr:hypothetical protein [Acinetobacter sp. HY1485]
MGSCNNCGRSWNYDGSIEQDNRCFNCQKIKKNITPDPWDLWIEVNKNKLIHPANYELLFVNKILRKISFLKPSDVYAQYHFQDSNGKNRYIDFYIKNEEFSYNLPIELDGLWKVKNYQDFNDMMFRQNSLIQKFKILLRYTNKQIQCNPHNTIEEISNILKMQKLKKETEFLEIITNNQQQMEYEKKIKELELKLKDNLKPSSKQVINSKIKNTIYKPIFIVSLIVFIFVAYEIYLNINSHLTSKSPNTEQVKLQISSDNSYKNIGKKKTICGKISQIKFFTKGVYLNMGNIYPNQDISFIVWTSNIDKFPSLEKFVGTNQCIYGKIIEHKGLPQVILNSSKQIQSPY